MRAASLYALPALLILAGCYAGPPQSSEPQYVNPDENAANAAENSSESERPYCYAARTDLPVEDCTLVTHQLADLKAGMGNLTAPKEMKRGATATVRFAIAPVGQNPVSPGKAKEQASGDKPKVPARVSTEIVIKIGRAMTATLEGSAFDIAPTGEQSRDLGASNKASWIWTVKAKEGGIQPLYLTVSTKALDAKGKATQLDLFSSEAEVAIKVTWWDRMSDILTAFTSLFTTTESTLKALAAMLAAAVAVVLTWRKFSSPSKPSGG